MGSVHGWGLLGGGGCLPAVGCSGGRGSCLPGCSLSRQPGRRPDGPLVRMPMCPCAPEGAPVCRQACVSRHAAKPVRPTTGASGLERGSPLQGGDGLVKGVASTATWSCGPIRPRPSSLWGGLPHSSPWHPWSRYELCYVAVNMLVCTKARNQKHMGTCAHTHTHITPHTHVPPPPPTQSQLFSLSGSEAQRMTPQGTSGTDALGRVCATAAARNLQHSHSAAGGWGPPLVGRGVGRSCEGCAPVRQHPWPSTPPGVRIQVCARAA